MKKILFSLFLLANAGTCFSQEYLDQIAKKSCECVEKISTTGKSEALSAEFGVCIIQSFTNEDKEKFQKDFGLSFKNILKDGEKIGSIIGTSMATQCPSTLVKLTATAKENHGKVTGVVTKIETDFFVVFSVKENSGKVTKLLWLNQLQSNSDLPNTYQTLLGKSVEAKYESKDIFDPKIGDYRSFKSIIYIK